MNKKASILIVLLFSTIFFSGCGLEVDPEFLPPQQLEKMATQQFYYSIYIGSISLILIGFGLFFISSGNWLGLVPLFLGCWLIYISNFEIISKRSAPKLSDEIEVIPEKVKNDFLEIDAMVSKYLLESVLSLKHGIIRGAAISLGAASERMIDQLIIRFGDSIESIPNREKYLSRIKSKSILKRYEEFLKSFKGMKKSPEESWAKDISNELDQMFHFLRIIRNESAHPFGEERVEREMIISQFGHFYRYAGTA